MFIFIYKKTTTMRHLLMVINSPPFPRINYITLPLSDKSGSATTVLSTKYLYNEQNVCFCLKGECFSNVLSIFVVLIMWHKQSNQHHENVLLGLLPCKNILLGLHPCPARCSPMGIQFSMFLFPNTFWMIYYTKLVQK